MECPMYKGNCCVNTVGFYQCYFNIYRMKYDEETEENVKFGKKFPN